MRSAYEVYSLSTWFTSDKTRRARVGAEWFLTPFLFPTFPSVFFFSSLPVDRAQAYHCL